MKYQLEVSYDHDTESPNDYGAFNVISFNSRHVSFVHPDDIDESTILAPLSYYEHGLCKWMVGESTVADPYGGFDTVDFAGVIVYNEANGGDRSWFTDMGPKEQRHILDGVAAEYTAWCNGECFYYTLNEIHGCESCGQVEFKHVDSCGGYIGSDSFSDYINSEVLFGIDPADVTVVGEAEYAVTLKPVQVSV